MSEVTAAVEALDLDLLHLIYVCLLSSARRV